MRLVPGTTIFVEPPAPKDKMEQSSDIIYTLYQHTPPGRVQPQRDGMAAILEKVLAADVLVLATPLYYYGMTAQLKAVIDRFCSENSAITARRLRSVLLAVAWNADSWTFDALEAHYDTLVRYLDLRDCGRVLGHGCGTPSMTRATDAPQRAFELGRSL